jgi:alkaline phosphatase
MGTGVVSTTRVTHATPAATYAHISDRDKENDIAAQLVPGGALYNPLLKDGIDVVFGGGCSFFVPSSDKCSGSSGKRTDGRNLIGELQAKGYAFASDKSGFDAIPASSKKAAALFTSSHMSYDLDRDPSKEPSLAEMTGKAMDILAKSDNGYFLMVEGGRIDHALHETNAIRALQDAKAFDQAIQTAIDKVKLTDPTLANTLIVVTADHDHTMVLNGYAKRTGASSAGNPGVLGVAKDYVTGAPLLDADKMPYSILGFGNGENRAQGARSAFPALTDAITGDKNYHQEAVVRVGVGSETHGGTDVFLGAIGAGAEQFHGFMDNTQVFKLLRDASGI